MGKSKTTAKRAIPTVVEPNPKTLLFSFKHLDLGNGKFSMEDCTSSFWRSLAIQLQRYSQLTVQDFLDMNNNDHRHMIDWSETTEPTGFAHLDTDQIGYSEPWQFGIDSRGRVSGLLIEPTFYIIWLDPNHALYPRYGPQLEQ